MSFFCDFRYLRVIYAASSIEVPGGAEGIVRVWGKALVAAVPLVAMLGAGVSAQSAAAAEPVITPASGSVITSSSVTIRVKSAVGGGTLYVDGRPVDTGKNEWLTYTINGKTTPNGTHKVKLAAVLPWDEASSTFRMEVPASAPSGVTASVKGSKVTVRWNKGGEPDLTGYTLSGDLGSRSVSAKACGAQCSVTLTAPATASGQATIQVVARRAGAAPSGASTRTVRLKGTAQPPSAPGNGNAPAPAPGPSYNWPSTSQSPLFPTVAPDPGDFSTESPDVSIVYPTPTDTSGLDPSVVSMDRTGLTGTMADESLQWGKSLAIALVLLLCAAHLGTWTRRLRTARATGPVGPRVVPGSAHARVEANRTRIEAALAAARGAAEEPDPSSEDKKGKKRKKRKTPPPLPETMELDAFTDTPDLEQGFPDELNLEYTPRPVTLPEPDPIEAADRPDPDPDTIPVDPDDLERMPSGTQQVDRETDAALATLIELATANAPDPDPDTPSAETPSAEPGDRTEILEHPRRRGLWRRRP